MTSDISVRFEARYSNGQSAEQHDVAVLCAIQGLIIENTKSQPIAEWDWKDVKLAEALTADRPIRLQNRSLEGERLAIPDQSILSQLEQLAPYLKRDPVSRAGVQKFTIIGALFLCFALFVIYGLPRIAGPLAESIPMEWEEEIGAGVVKTVTKIFSANESKCENPKGLLALQHLTDRLAATVDTPYRFKVRVAKSKVVNAFAAPGGHIVILSGLIEKADTLEEVAGVLAHEMGHVIKRHPAKALIHAYGWSMLITALTGVSGSSGDLASGFALHLANASYSRSNEAEADETAIEILTLAKINNTGLVNFFKKLLNEGKAEGTRNDDDLVLKYLASHPTLRERIDAIQAKPKPPRGTPISEDDWQAIQNICD
ncbi:MAG: hypothetical protein CMM28_10595 [Rhodospirillaceae bacterium]|nr:hypothetical protein [Rhodospirillaceae bacterium]